MKIIVIIDDKVMNLKCRSMNIIFWIKRQMEINVKNVKKALTKCYHLYMLSTILEIFFGRIGYILFTARFSTTRSMFETFDVLIRSDNYFQFSITFPLDGFH